MTPVRLESATPSVTSQHSTLSRSVHDIYGHVDDIHGSVLHVYDPVDYIHMGLATIYMDL